MKHTNSLQDIFINNARKEKVELTVFLVNGVPVRGKVISFDSYTILLDVDKKQNLIFKHAISTIVPAKPVPYTEQE